jgi:hypothetical protein
LALLDAEIGLHRGFAAVVLVDVLQHQLGVGETLGVDVIQGDDGVGKGRGQHAVAEDILGEHGATGTHEGDLGHGTILMV